MTLLLTKLSRKNIDLTQRRSVSLVRIFIVIGVALVIIALTHTPTTAVHADSKSEKEAGAELFHVSGCEYCHGADARGTDRGPDLSTVGKRKNKDQIERQIRDGGGAMPPFGSALQPDQIQALVAFLHAKKKAAPTPRGQKGSETSPTNGANGSVDKSLPSLSL